MNILFFSQNRKASKSTIPVQSSSIMGGMIDEIPEMAAWTGGMTGTVQIKIAGAPVKTVDLSTVQFDFLGFGPTIDLGFPSVNLPFDKITVTYSNVSWTGSSVSDVNWYGIIGVNITDQDDYDIYSRREYLLSNMIEDHYGEPISGTCIFEGINYSGDAGNPNIYIELKIIPAYSNAEAFQFSHRNLKFVNNSGQMIIENRGTGYKMYCNLDLLDSRNESNSIPLSSHSMTELCPEGIDTTTYNFDQGSGSYDLADSFAFDSVRVSVQELGNLPKDSSYQIVISNVSVKVNGEEYADPSLVLSYTYTGYSYETFTLMKPLYYGRLIAGNIETSFTVTVNSLIR